MPIIHAPRDGDQRSGRDRDKQDPRFDSVPFLVVNVHLASDVLGQTSTPISSLSHLRPRGPTKLTNNKNTMPAHEKLACPLGKLLKPSLSRSVRVQIVHEVKPSVGLEV
jgi:hypothetical protein